jgi:hypothetical protein
MGTTLTGTTPATTYDSLIKVTDNGPISGTAKYLSDGLGNDSALALSTGNIGIGTSAPTVALEVNGAVKFVDSGAGGPDLSFGNIGGSTFINNIAAARNYYGAYEHVFTNGDNSIERFRINSDGNVGIGTSSPTDTIGYGRALDIQSSTGAVVYLRDSNAPTTQYGFLAFDGTDNGLKLQNANSSGFLRFDTNATERMRIDSTGNVGIGTSLPANKLDVVGNINVGSANWCRYASDTPHYVDRSTGNLNIRTNQNSSDIVFSTSAALFAASVFSTHHLRRQRRYWDRCAYGTFTRCRRCKGN